MLKILIIIIILIILIVIMCRSKIFPLGAGTADSGWAAVRSIELQTVKRGMREYPLVAAIVEPRKDNLVFILNHFLEVMPEYTHFQVYHGTDNNELLHENFQNLINSGKISLWNLGVSNLTIHSYSALLTSKQFWESIQSENVLIFQTDAITCNKSKFKINDFIDYAFIGAPLTKHVRFLINTLFLGKGYVIAHYDFYNGGLSFRKKSKMLAVIKKFPWDELSTEDIWFCAFLPQVGGKLPRIDVARNFSFESESLSASAPFNEPSWPSGPQFIR
jgi:hypothetical protein